jgi:hypothetical protein
MRSETSLSNLLVAKIFIWVFSFLSFILLLIYSVVPISFLMNFQLIKDLILFFCVFVLFYSWLDRGEFKIKRDLLFFLILLYTLILFVFCLLSEASLKFSIYNFRKIISLFILFILFKNLFLLKESFNKLLKYINSLFIVFFVFGLIDFYFGEFFWDSIFNLSGFWNSNSTDFAELNSFSQSGRAYSSDLYFLTGERNRRIMSFFLEPTAYASFLSVALAYNVLISKNKVFILLILLSGMLTFSKFFIFSIFIIYTILYFKRIRISLVIFFTFILFFISKYLYETFALFHGSFSHFNGFYTGFNLLKDNIFGFGLGVAGNRGESLISTMNGEFGGESGLGNIMAQIGIVGFIHGLLLLLIIHKVSILYKYTRNVNFQFILAIMLCYYLNFLLSASSLSLTSQGIYFILAGIALNTKFINN